MRALVESGGVEGFLTDLLFIRLHASGHKVTRELPTGKRFSADIGIYEPAPIYIEAKQLHLKDGTKCALGNLARDLIRHNDQRSLGVLYIADERKSQSSRGFNRYANANRLAKCSIEQICKVLPKYFEIVYPSSLHESLLREFPPIHEYKDDGGLQLYGFVVDNPIPLK